MSRRSPKQNSYEIYYQSRSVSRLGLFSHRTQVGAIDFSTDQELENKLENLFNQIKTKSSWFKKESSLFFYHRDLFNPKPLPPFAAGTFKKVIQRHQFISSIDIEHTLFTQKEREEMAQIGKARQKEQARRESNINYYFLLGATNGILAAFSAGMALPFIAIKMASESLISAFVGYVRQKYLDFSANFYSTSSKVKNRSEKLAFEYGVKSTSTFEWLKAFFRLSTYLHPFAFAAGLEHTNRKNDDVIAKVLDMRLANEKRYVIRAQINQKKGTSDIYSKWIHFNNGRDLQAQLQDIVNEYKGNFTITTAPATLTLSKEDAMHLPSYVHRYVQEVILDNQCIQEVSFKPNRNQPMFFRPISKELQADCRHNAKENRRQNKNFDRSFTFWGIIGAIFTRRAPFAFGIGILGALFNYTRQSFLNRAIKPYNTTAKIAHIHNKAEQKALAYGVKAGKSYKELFYSWGRKEAYTELSAFEAGKEITMMEGNRDFIQKIQRFKV